MNSPEQMPEEAPKKPEINLKERFKSPSVRAYQEAERVAEQEDPLSQTVEISPEEKAELIRKELEKKQTNTTFGSEEQLEPSDAKTQEESKTKKSFWKRIFSGS